MKAHAPQDELHGPLNIPSYCWPIIDTPEFQRLRHITQLGTSTFVYPGANHTRFEHSLGVCHLASRFMSHLQEVQPELNLKPEWKQAVNVAGLCHDLGHGPWSHCFESAIHRIDPEFDHEENSKRILKFIINKYNITIIPKEVIEAACCFISGTPYDPYPLWLSQIIANNVTDLDLDKYDYLSRDINRCVQVSQFEFNRLIVHTRVKENQLVWRLSEQPTIDRLFYTRNNMHERVYQHKVTSGINVMISDMFFEADERLNLKNAIQDIESYCKLDCRILAKFETGDFGEASQKIAQRLRVRNLYKFVGELRFHDDVPSSIFSMSPKELLDEIAACGSTPIEIMRYSGISFRYGLSKDFSPFLAIPFWNPEDDTVIHLKESELTCLGPERYHDKGFRIYITDRAYTVEAQQQFQTWLTEKGINKS